MTLTVGSLFSGIGGLDLGLERAGMRVIWQSEIDPYATRVLAKHWPEVPNLGDIKRIDWGDVVRPDVICGGYPCQPFSTAGQRKGEEDPRHLWPWVREALRVLRPRYAILENVRGHLSLGGTTVLSEIAALGYSAEWRVVSAASVGANHRRDRVIIVAYPNGQNEPDGPEHEVGLVAYPDDDGHAPSQKPRSSATRSDGNETGSQPPRKSSRRSLKRASLADADGSSPTDGGQRSALPSEDRSGRNDRGGSDRDPREVTLRGAGEDPRNLANSEIFGCYGRRHGNDPSRSGAAWVQQQIRRSGSDYAGAANWETEPDVGRVANGIPARVDRLRGLGNAVVPQVAETIGRLVVAHNEQQPR